MNPESYQALRKARELLTPEGAWTQGEFARDGSGERILLASPEARCFCLAGAIFKTIQPATEKIYLEILEAFTLRTGNTLTRWNDSPGRTQEEVLALLDALIAEGSPSP